MGRNNFWAVSRAGQPKKRLEFPSGAYSFVSLACRRFKVRGLVAVVTEYTAACASQPRGAVGAVRSFEDVCSRRGGDW